MSPMLDSETLEADEATIRALEDLPDYAPIKHEYSLDMMVMLNAETKQVIQTLENLLRDQERIRRAIAVTRAAANTITRKRHKAAVAIRSSVKLQYGEDSPILKTVGLKPRSEYKRPKRKPKKTDGAGEA